MSKPTTSYESACLRSIETLLENYHGIVKMSVNFAVPQGQHMRNEYAKRVEDLRDVYLIELERISPRKWQVVMMSTNDNSYNLEDDKFFLSSSNFNLLVLTEQVEIVQYNTLRGFYHDYVSAYELEKTPELFAVYDENDKEIPQIELMERYEKQLRRLGYAQ